MPARPAAASHDPLPPDASLKLGDPYCGACGHQLSGLIDSSKCPECGRPIIEVLTRAGRMGRRYRSKTTLFGLPLIDIAFGPTHSETRGEARGIFALGDKAKGLVAVGGLATGVVAVGGRAIGIFSVGGMSIGLLTSCGGLSIGAITVGGLSVGLLSSGGISTGLVADGGVAVGLYAAGGLPIALAGASADATIDVFNMFSWFFGRAQPFNALRYILQPWAFVLGVPIFAASVIALLAAVRHAAGERTVRTP